MPDPVRRLCIITADDFGLHAAVNEAVESAHRAGVLTAASLMVGAPAAQDAARRALELPNLRVGLHLTLADGRALLPRRQIPDLVDADNRFHDNMVGAGWRFFASPSVRAQLAAEIRAQFAAFAALGLKLDHLDAHKHFHLHPTVLSLALRIGTEFGLRAVRIPAEPGLTATRLLSPWLALMRRRARRAGMACNDQIYGLAHSGAMDEARLLRILASLPPGVSEIYLHPATLSGRAIATSMPNYRHRDELQALLSAAVRGALEAAAIRLGGYGDIAAFRTAAAP
ncbi:MAG TPA: hopanoid biosynthesis-associated protein HpnK [Steroidobacteraceae bacterium]|nr:hopanoid biosynthesis-associated protein HpnK [Steroidobacteraceae bacterium]